MLYSQFILGINHQNVIGMSYGTQNKCLFKETVQCPNLTQSVLIITVIHTRHWMFINFHTVKFVIVQNNNLEKIAHPD